MTEAPKREDILRTVMNYALTDVLYDLLARESDNDAGAAFRVKVNYYTTKYRKLNFTDAEVDYMVEAICNLESAEIDMDAKITLLKEAPK